MVVKNYVINGRVIGSRNKNGLYNLRVEAWEKDMKYNDLLGQTVTNSEGNFIVRFDSTYFREHSPEAEPDIFFKVYMGRKLVKSTEEEPLKNAPEKVEVTILVDTPELQGEDTKKDRLSSRQVTKAASFLAESDFNAVYRQYKEKAGTSFGFISDLVVNTVKDFDLKPLQVEGARDEEIINENPNDARRKLAAMDINVNQEHEYNPRLDKKSFSGFKVLPPNLKAGQSVDIYVKDNQVKYYRVIDPSIDEAGGSTEDDKRRNEEIAKMKIELETTKELAAKKDSEILQLQNELVSIRKNQDSINTILKSDKLARFLAADDTDEEPKKPKGRRKNPPKHDGGVESCALKVCESFASPR